MNNINNNNHNNNNYNYNIWDFNLNVDHFNEDDFDNSSLNLPSDQDLLQGVHQPVIFSSPSLPLSYPTLPQSIPYVSHTTSQFSVTNQQGTKQLIPDTLPVTDLAPLQAIKALWNLVNNTPELNTIQQRAFIEFITNYEYCLSNFKKTNVYSALIKRMFSRILTDYWLPKNSNADVSVRNALKSLFMYKLNKNTGKFKDQKLISMLTENIVSPRIIKNPPLSKYSTIEFIIKELIHDHLFRSTIDQILITIVKNTSILTISDFTKIDAIRGFIKRLNENPPVALSPPQSPNQIQDNNNNNNSIVAIETPIIPIDSLSLEQIKAFENWVHPKYAQTDHEFIHQLYAIDPDKKDCRVCGIEPIKLLNLLQQAKNVLITCDYQKSLNINGVLQKLFLSALNQTIDADNINIFKKLFKEVSHTHERLGCYKIFEFLHFEIESDTEFQKSIYKKLLELETTIKDKSILTKIKQLKYYIENCNSSLEILSTETETIPQTQTITTTTTHSNQIQTNIDPHMTSLIDLISVSWKNKQLRQELIYHIGQLHGHWALLPFHLSSTAKKHFFLPFVVFLSNTKNNLEKAQRLKSVQSAFRMMHSSFSNQFSGLTTDEQSKISEQSIKFPASKNEFLNQNHFSKEQIEGLVEQCCCHILYQNSTITTQCHSLSSQESQRFANTLFFANEMALKVQGPMTMHKTSQRPPQVCLIIAQDVRKIYVRPFIASFNLAGLITHIRNCDQPSLFRILKESKGKLKEDGGYTFENKNDFEEFLDQIKSETISFMILSQANASFDLTVDPRHFFQPPTLSQELSQPVNQEFLQHTTLTSEPITSSGFSDKVVDRAAKLTSETPPRVPDVNNRKRKHPLLEESLDGLSASFSGNSSSRTKKSKMAIKPGYQEQGSLNLLGYHSVSIKNSTKEDSNTDQKNPFIANVSGKFTALNEQKPLNARTFWEDFSQIALDKVQKNITTEQMRKIALDIKEKIEPLDFPIIHQLNSMPKMQAVTPFNGLLKSYQKKDFLRLLQLIKHGITPILAMTMGLGKTFTFAELIFQKIFIEGLGIYIIVTPQDVVNGLYGQVLIVASESVVNAWRNALDPSNKHVLETLLTSYKPTEIFLKEDALASLFLDLKKGTGNSLTDIKMLLRIYQMLPGKTKDFLGNFFPFIKTNASTISESVKEHLTSLYKGKSPNELKNLNDHLRKLLNECYLPINHLSNLSILQEWITSWNNKINTINTKCLQNNTEINTEMPSLISSLALNPSAELAKTASYSVRYLSLFGNLLDYQPSASQASINLNQAIQNPKGLLALLTFHLNKVQAIPSAKEYKPENIKQLNPQENPILITSYAVAQKIFPVNSAGAIPCDKVKCVIFDEVQRCHTDGTFNSTWLKNFILSVKNAASQSWISMVTGTPVENNLAELCLLLEAGTPGGFNEKAKKAMDELLRNTTAAIQGNNSNETMKMLIRSFIHHRAFADLISKLVIWRERDQEVVTDWQGRVPQRVDVILPIKIKNAVTEVIKRIENEFKQKPTMSTVNKQKILGVLLHSTLDEKAVNQDKVNEVIQPLINHNFARFKEESTLISGLLNCNEMNQVIVNKERAIVFVDLIGVGQTVQTSLEKEFANEVDIRFYNGSLTTNERKNILDWYDKDDTLNKKAKILILSEKAGGVGLNLPKAKYGFNLMFDYNDSAEEQALARMFRVGSIGERLFVHFNYLLKIGHDTWDSLFSFKHISILKENKKLLKQFLASANTPDLKTHFAIWVDYLKALIHQRTLNDLRDVAEAKKTIDELIPILEQLKEDVNPNDLKELLKLATPSSSQRIQEVTDPEEVMDVDVPSIVDLSYNKMSKYQGYSQPPITPAPINPASTMPNRSGKWPFLENLSPINGISKVNTIPKATWKQPRNHYEKIDLDIDLLDHINAIGLGYAYAAFESSYSENGRAATTFIQSKGKDNESAKCLKDLGQRKMEKRFYISEVTERGNEIIFDQLYIPNFCVIRQGNTLYLKKRMLEN